jgi:hypothetical protein
MPVDAVTLSLLASDYARDMTSIRARRVQRLLKREFAGAEVVLMVETSGVGPAVLGLSATGAAFCATDGRGRRASVVGWLHDWPAALETGFDLLKDSLPVLDVRSVPLAGPPREALLLIAPSSIPEEARHLVMKATRALR